MTVKELKERLACFSDDDHLIVNWWSQDEFDITSEKAWSRLVSKAESRVDWGAVSDQIAIIGSEAGLLKD
jgi:hypothetical protein